MKKKQMLKTVTALISVALLAVVMKRATPTDVGETEPEVATEVSVQVGKIVRTTLRKHIGGFGSVEPEPVTAGEPAAGATVAPALAGVVTEVACVEGQRVEKGAALFRLDDRVARAAAAKARQAARFAGEVLDRENTLFQGQNTSLKKLEEAKSRVALAEADLAGAEARLELLTIRAPLSATVMRVNARPGDSVGPGVGLAELTDLNRLVVSVKVPAFESAGLATGQAVEYPEVSDDATPLRGTVTFVSPGVDAASDTVLVRCSLPAGTALSPGRFLRVRIVMEEHTGCLAVPLVSVVTGENGQSFIALVDGDHAVRTPVTTGLRDGDRIEIQGEGLAEGDTIVTTGAYGLPDETRIKVANR